MSVTFRIWCPHSRDKIRGDLEFDAESFFAPDDGLFAGAGGWEKGFDVEIELADEARWEERVPRLKQFLKDAGYPQGTYIEVFPPDWDEGDEVPYFEVFGE
jgi:hypothetical protein